MKKRVFVAAPHRTESGFVLTAIREALDLVSYGPELTFEVFDPDVRRSSRNPVDSLRDQIANADLVVADLSGANSNVLFEIGYAEAAGKPILLLSEDSGHVPFDVRDKLILLYQPSAPLSNLTLRIAEAIERIFRPDRSASGRKDLTVEKRHKLFISYSHADRQFLDRIVVHLRPLERQNLIEFWSDTNIKPGDRWKAEIRQALDAARTAVLLISADFLASDFIVTNELPPLLAAAERDGTLIIPLIVKPSRFVRDDSLSCFQALNDPKEPLIKMGEGEREEVYSRLAEIVELNLGSVSHR